MPCQLCLWRKLRRHLWGWLLGMLAWAALAQPLSGPQLLIVNSDASATYLDAARILTAQLGKAGVAADTVQQITAAELGVILKSGKLLQPRLVVALGSESVSVLARSGVQVPVLAALIPRSSFEQAMGSRRASSQFSAIYLDQPLARQLGLIRLALPQARRVGVLLGPDSVRRAPRLKSLAASSGLTLVAAQVEAGSGVFPALKQALDDSDVLLALADPQVYNNNSIQNILLSAFRAGVPMVGFSPAYVRAGALLSLHVTPTQAAVQTAALALDVLAGRPLPASPQESDDFEVGVNAHVARSLGLTLNPAALRRALRDAERLP